MRRFTLFLLVLPLYGQITQYPQGGGGGGGDATSINGAAVPISQACVGTNGSGQIVSASCSGGIAWGAITGTLSDQTDLATALNAKALLTTNTFSSTQTFTVAPVFTNASGTRTALGLGTAATQATGTFFQIANNLSDGTAATMRTNLGLGTAATTASTAYDASGAAAAAQSAAQTFSANASNLSSGTVPAAQLPALTGDITTSAGTVATTLAGTITGAKTFSGALTFSAAGAASTPALTLPGTPFAGTGTTSYPLAYFNCTGSTQPTTLNTAGTWFGVNTCTGSTSDFFRFGINGAASVATLSSAGALTLTSSLTVGGASTILFSGRSKFSSPSNGNMLVQNAAGSAFTGLQFGGTTSSFPELNVNSTALEAKLADASAYTGFNALTFTTELGGKQTCTHGSNGTCGVITLTAGAATISTTAIATLAASAGAGDFVQLSCANNPATTTTTACATQPFVSAITAGTSFVITGTLTDTVYWEIKHIN